MKTYPNARAFLRDVASGRVDVRNVATVSEIAITLGVTRQAVSNALSRGVISGWRIARGDAFVDASTVRAWLLGRGDPTRARQAARFSTIAATARRLGVDE